MLLDSANPITMSLSTEALFTAALGLQTPWRVERAELSTASK